MNNKQRLCRVGHRRNIPEKIKADIVRLAGIQMSSIPEAVYSARRVQDVSLNTAAFWFYDTNISHVSPWRYAPWCMLSCHADPSCEEYVITNQKTTVCCCCCCSFLHEPGLRCQYILHFDALTSSSHPEWLKDALRFLLLWPTEWPPYISRGLIGLLINTSDSTITLPGTNRDFSAVSSEAPAPSSSPRRLGDGGEMQSVTVHQPQQQTHFVLQLQNQSGVILLHDASRL